MTARYTPAFSDIYFGTLYGKWPAAAVWASLLPLFDRDGRLDMSYQAISGTIGWPIELLRLGIGQLMEPDPASRSSAHQGRRMIPLEQGRDWGWIAVNHAKHAERARLKAKNEHEVESGKNRNRLSSTQPVTAGDRRSPPETASTSTSTSGLQEERARKRATRLSADAVLTPEWVEIAKRQGIGDPKAITKAFVKFKNYWLAKSGKDAAKLEWDRTWENWCIEELSRTPAGKLNGHSFSPEAAEAWESLIKAEGMRTPKQEYALKRLGGFSVIRERRPDNSERLRSDFCRFYEEAPIQAAA